MIPGTEGEVEGIAHLIQMAIAPVFLLNGLGILLNVFTGRLARVVDRTRNLAREMRGQCEPERHAQLKSELGTQRLRLFVVNGAIGLVSISAFLTCCAILALFVGGVAKQSAGAAPVGFFAAAVVAVILALGLFLIEVYVSTRALRQETADLEA
ncbi:MAG: DUF2721 domain-containing protein [Tagaea sp.]|nr:DUF2721 domain-containing protein [Azospirillum sp.]MCZ8124791.1 DUF2721 domain-containing protein [Magnetospirillum sp.]